MGNPYSQLSTDDFQQAALNLLPRGWAWPRALNTTLASFFGAIGDLFAKVHADITDVADVELYPPTTQALLPEFEVDNGLPDPCFPQPQTYEQRIAALMAKITNLGSLSVQKFIDLAASLGFTITITQFLPSANLGTCVGTCVAPVLGPSWKFAWQVNALATTYSLLSCNGFCTSPLASWGNTSLECAINRMNRPSRFVLFSYG